MRPILATAGELRPGSCSHVTPPSAEWYTPFRVLPPVLPSAANTLFPSRGSNSTEVAVPVSVRVQVAPPSEDRHNPLCAEQRTKPVMEGLTAIPPILSRKNGPRMLVQVEPASVDLRIPAP